MSFLYPDGRLVKEHQRRQQHIKQMKAPHTMKNLVMKCLENDRHERPNVVQIRDEIEGIKGRRKALRRRIGGGEHMKLQISFLGDSGVGKSAIIHRFMDRNAKMLQLRATCGLDYLYRDITVRGQTIRLKLLDTPGQERYEDTIPQYVRTSDGVLLVYDVTECESLGNLRKWLQFSRNHTHEDAILMVVGNKIDLGQKRMVDRSQAQAFVHDNDDIAEYLETSALTRAKLDEVFQRMAEKIFEDLDLENIRDDPLLGPETVILTEKPEKPSKSKCCSSS